MFDPWKLNRTAAGLIDLGCFLPAETGKEKLLRKEVIQPQVPLRLPCYDFTPITDPTFARFAPCGFVHRLRVLPAFVV